MTDSLVSREQKFHDIVQRHPLSEQHRQFVEQYLATSSAADAAEFAGYQRSYGYALTKHPQIKAAIAECIENDEYVMQRQERLRLLTAYARGMVPGADHRARLQALQLLLKVSGDLDESTRVQIANISQQTGPSIDLSKLSTEQLEQLNGIMTTAADDVAE